MARFDSEPWWEGPLVGLDCETTSAEPEDARIVTVAIVLAHAHRPTVSRTWLVNPGVEIPDEAAEIHGVTTERAQAEGLEPTATLAEILALLDSRPAGAPIVCFNARYDLTVLDREARRHGLTPLVNYAPVIDPLVLDKWLHRYRKGSRRLDAQAAHYGATLDDAHDAGSDALAAARVAWCIGRRGEVVRRVRNGQEGREKAALVREWDRVRGDLPALHAAQVRWAHDQAVSLADYFRRQGDAAKGRPEDVATEWPLIPFRESVTA